MDSSSPKPQRLRIRAGILAAFCCLLVLAGLHLLGAFTAIDLKLSDWRFRLRGERAASEQIALVAVDDRSVAALQHRWPLSRDLFAALLDGLQAAKPRAVGVDLLFVGPSGDDPRFDQLLAMVAAAGPRVVYAVNFPPDVAADARGAGLPAAEQAALRRHGVPGSLARTQEAQRVLLPYRELLCAAPALAHVVVLVDPDGSVRRLPLYVRHEGLLYPALALRLVALARGDSLPPHVQPVHGGAEVQLPHGERLRVPLDREGGTAIDFAGDRGAFAHTYSMLDVLGWIQAGDTARLAAAFADRIVLVGATATGEAVADQGSTPFASGTALVYVHANALDALLGGRFVRAVPGATLLGLAVLAGLCGWLFVAFPLQLAAGAMAACTLLLAVVNFGLFALARLDVPSTVVLVLPSLAYAVIASYRFVFVERHVREKEKELDAARLIQKRLLPAAAPTIPGLDLFGFNVPAREVGGDYFDFLPLQSGRLVALLGDVSGKGVPAALLMSHLQASLHANARDDLSAHQILAAMDRLLYSSIESGRFATCFLAIIDPANNRFHYCNAGHNPAILVRRGERELLESTGVPLGLLPASQYHDGERPFEPGDLLFIYSDGITECLHKGEFFGDERLYSLVSELASRPLSSQELGEAVLADLRRFAHDNLESDDVTLVVARRV